MKKPSKRTVPAFASEAEEAAWWHENRKSHDREFAAAVENGEAQVLTGERLRKRIEAAKVKAPGHVISLRVPETDLAMARKQAEQKGLPYQTYIKSILHETLAEREKRKAGRKAAPPCRGSGVRDRDRKVVNEVHWLLN